jgi:hypothetical protein
MSYLERRNPTIKLSVVVLVALALTFDFDPAMPAAIGVITLLAGRLLGGLSIPSSLTKRTPPLRPSSPWAR